MHATGRWTSKPKLQAEITKGTTENIRSRQQQWGDKLQNRRRKKCDTVYILNKSKSERYHWSGERKIISQWTGNMQEEMAHRHPSAIYWKGMVSFSWCGSKEVNGQLYRTWSGWHESCAQRTKRDQESMSRTGSKMVMQDDEMGALQRSTAKGKMSHIECISVYGFLNFGLFFGFWYLILGEYGRYSRSRRRRPRFKMGVSCSWWIWWVIVVIPRFW